MPVTPTYPGVYIEEVPSGVRTITGVATSITAFVGRTLRGPVNQAVRIQSFSEFERTFGRLWVRSTLSYAVQQYFLNGGTDAIIVRVVDTVGVATLSLPVTGDIPLVLRAIASGSAGLALQASVTDGANADEFNLTITDTSKNPEKTGSLTNTTIESVEKQLAEHSTLKTMVALQEPLPTTRPDNATDVSAQSGDDRTWAATLKLAGEEGDLTLNAANEGAWGNSLQATVDHDTRDNSDTKLFNLTIEDIATGAVETFRNVSVDDESPRFVTRILEQESAFVRVTGTLPTERPSKTVTTENETTKITPVPAGGGNDGLAIEDANVESGLMALESVDLFNLLCLPPLTRDKDINPATYTKALKLCKDRRAMLLVDPPNSWNNVADVTNEANGVGSLGLTNENAAIFFPRFRAADSLQENRLEEFAPCGAVAGIFARTDAQRGVWKAPAGLEATVTGARELSVKLTDGQNGLLNPLGVNCLRTFPAVGSVVWGARTLRGADRLGSQWKYIPVRRLALFIEESLYRGTQWVVFEPNDEPLWAQIRLNIGAFMQNLFRQGAFQGTSPRQAYLVKCDRETTTQNDINLGIVNIVVGFAPLKPAEFVILNIQQMAGQIET